MQLGKFYLSSLSILLGHVFAWVYGKKVETAPSWEGGLVVNHRYFSVDIGSHCGGGTGILFFLFAFFTLWLLAPRLLSPRSWFTHFVGGIFVFYLLNIARILLLFQTGIVLGRTFGTPRGVDIFEHFIHPHAGWVLYTLGLGGFFSGLFRRAIREELRVRPPMIFRSRIDSRPRPILRCLAIGLLAGFLFASPSARGEECDSGSSCTTDLNCASDSLGYAYCEVGPGVCCNCCTYITQGTCPGACSWTSGQCRNSMSVACSSSVPEVPSRWIPYYLIFIVLAMSAAVFWFRRRKKRIPISR